jgi:hypothetical protein
MLGERRPTSDRHAYDAGYDRGQVDGMQAYRTPDTLYPTEVPAPFNEVHRRDHFATGWKDGIMFSIRARGVAKTM